MERYTIFGHNACGYCLRAKQDLDNRRLPYRFVNIHEEGISAADLEKTVGRPVRTVPQIFHGSNYIGGYTELSRYLASA